MLRLKKSLWVIAKSLDCLFTHWLKITSSVFWIEAIFSKIFEFNYLEKENFFSILFLIL